MQLDILMRLIILFKMLEIVNEYCPSQLSHSDINLIYLTGFNPIARSNQCILNLINHYSEKYPSLLTITAYGSAKYITYSTFILL